MSKPYTTTAGYGFTTRVLHIAWAVAATVTLSALTGCGDEEIRAYQAPKAEPFQEPQLMTTPPADAGPQPAQATWDVPDAWTEAPSTSSFLLAVYEAQGEAGPARITVSQLTGDGGGVIQNINRWRGQVGLGPIQRFEDQPMTPIQIGPDTAGLIDLAAPEGVDAGLERLMVVFIPRQDQNLTWYFKMSGPTDTLETQKQAFVGFIESVRFDSPAEEPSEPAKEATESNTSGGGGGGE